MRVWTAFFVANMIIVIHLGHLYAMVMSIVSTVPTKKIVRSYFHRANIARRIMTYYFQAFVKAISTHVYKERMWAVVLLARRTDASPVLPIRMYVHVNTIVVTIVSTMWWWHWIIRRHSFQTWQRLSILRCYRSIVSMQWNIQVNHIYDRWHSSVSPVNLLVMTFSWRIDRRLTDCVYTGDDDLFHSWETLASTSDLPSIN
jgi:hypothetical protein